MSAGVFDLRIPLGYLFVVLGALLLLASFFAPAEANARSLGININLLWGGVLMAFGFLCLALAQRTKRRRLRAVGADRNGF